MMAGLFGIMALSFGALILGWRGISIMLWIGGMFLSGLMFLHHATDTLKIMW